MVKYVENFMISIHKINTEILYGVINLKEILIDNLDLHKPIVEKVCFENLKWSDRLTGFYDSPCEKNIP